MKFLTLMSCLVLGLVSCKPGRNEGAALKTEEVTRGDIRQLVQTTGDIQPKNKVQILPPVAGRIDKVLVFEGSAVKKGQILAWMSSADRAALLDMARAEGGKKSRYWEDTYKATPIMAPVDGILISRNIVEGQTVGGNSPLYDLSDSLVVRAQVDENDIGKIRLGQRAEVSVDSYEDLTFAAAVELINPSAVIINQVVSYYVLLKMKGAPADLKTGMSANVNFILSEEKGVLTLPSYAVRGEENTEVELQVVRKKGTPGEARQVSLGDSDGSRVTVLSGLAEGERVAVPELRLQEAAPTGPFGGQTSSGKVKPAAKQGAAGWKKK